MSLREIRFRAWIRIPERQEGFMISWEKLQDAMGHQRPVHVAKRTAAALDFDERDYDFYETITGNVFTDPRLTLMQFTGLRDRHGKEIYEGDVLACRFYKKSGEFNNVVVFLDGMFCLQPNEKLHQVKRPLYRSMEMAKEANNAYEILGNIYEHLELTQEAR